MGGEEGEEPACPLPAQPLLQAASSSLGGGRRQLLIQAVGASALHGEGSAFFSCSASFFAVQNTVSPGKEVRAKAGGPETWDHRPSRNSAQTERGL